MRPAANRGPDSRGDGGWGMGCVGGEPTTDLWGEKWIQTNEMFFNLLGFTPTFFPFHG